MVPNNEKETRKLNIQNSDLKLTAGAEEQLIKTGLPQIAFSGRSNVGKSSLVNCLLGRRKLARVSSSPGKTVTVNYYNVDGTLFLVDLPGYGFAGRSFADKKRWSAMTQNYFEGNDSLRAVLQLVDIRVGITSDDADMLSYLAYYDIPHIIVATKCDKPNKTQLNENAKKIITHPAVKPGTPCILFSSHTGQGREALWNEILKLALNQTEDGK